MAEAIDFYDTIALGLVSKRGAKIESFTAGETLNPPSFFLWVEVPAAGGNLIVELADDPVGQQTMFTITRNDIYPIRARMIWDGSTVTSVTPLYPREVAV